jgi:hypothetical protein
MLLLRTNKNKAKKKEQKEKNEKKKKLTSLNEECCKAHKEKMK